MRQLEMFPGADAAKAYFNTTKLSKEKLIEANAEALDQEVAILEIFKKNSPLSPSDAWRIFERNYRSILLTSVRRSVTNLTTKGYLIKTSVQKIGVYKKPEYVWKYQPPVAQ